MQVLITWRIEEEINKTYFITRTRYSTNYN